MGFTEQQAADIAFTLLSADGKPLHVRLQEIENALAELKAAITAPAPVAADLAALTEILQGPAFLAALAKAVNDDAAARLAD